ncbi:CoA ester lyase [Mesorhizobium sp. M7A.F.Ca.US.014.04.1.1]|nr:citryl-CoA lyase [Mesorhizobium ciceri]AZO45951.1 CoA ester lyase [Mesorhizobium sp. M7D.F.Ca.US.005.01.1.1]MBE1711645.1 CoA ester lyase [Mesorhizobium japonicum]PBB17551.1 CoA ester lyase [Mesorhizobium sp. WSM4313]PBB23216.1 CoA ester lyase [Mesorhizobium sp. WSM4304]PBB46254.1 CoA ester lyase [Mesorhizobium loti]PBB65854.1 CoA ester lyase [Mesorhizobium sp. WSM4312]PBB72013.1 CoA ester lyase [Mesorhizobium sp. WSM4308]PBC19892.1 CoA ester lyase [Mesorhizobium sp. WSM4311]RUV13531.1 C
MKDTFAAVEGAMSVPRWRSLLFVPVHVPRFVETAHERGADGVILDLEDSVPQDRKGESRQQLPECVAEVGRKGASVLVRVNHGLRALAADLDAAVMAGVDALVLPKTDSAEWVIEIANAVSELERERNLPQGGIRFLAQIETPGALQRLAAIASAHPRMVAMALGPEDFSAAVGGAPGFDLLLTPNLSVLFAARAAGLLPLGFIGSIGEFSDTHKLREAAVRARRLGFAGALAIHPTQVAIFNEAFSPSAQELEWAHKVVAAANDAATRGLSAFSLNGKMIDPPVVRRAHEILILVGNN